MDLVVHDVSQPPPSNFVRGEDLTLYAGGTGLTVADSITGIPAHGGVMLLDLVRQIRDVGHWLKCMGSEVLGGNSLPFFLRRRKRVPAHDTRRAGFPDVIYRGGVKSGIAAG